MNEGVQFEILVDGKPQSYGALKDVAIEAARLMRPVQARRRAYAGGETTAATGAATPRVSGSLRY